MARFYVPLDVNYQLDDKIMCAGHVAECLYVRALAYAKRAGSEGTIMHSQLRALALGLPGQPTKHATTLVDVGLWEAVGDEYYITGWLNHNLTNAALLEQKAMIRRKSIAGNHKRHHTAKGLIDDDCELCNPPTGETFTSPQGSKPLATEENRTEPKKNRTEPNRTEEKRKEPSSSSSEFKTPPVDKPEEDEDRILIDNAMEVVIDRLTRKANPGDAFAYADKLREDERHRRADLAVRHKHHPHFSASQLADVHLGRSIEWIEAEIRESALPPVVLEPAEPYVPEPYVEPNKCPGCKFPQVYIDELGCQFKRKPGKEPDVCFHTTPEAGIATVTPIRQETK